MDFCPDCARLLVPRRGDRCQILACPNWCYAIVIFHDIDVRMHAGMLEALPMARSMPHGNGIM